MTEESELPSIVAISAMLAQGYGCSVVPARTDGSKAPAGRWKERMLAPASADEVASTFADHSLTGMGVITGAVSGHLEMIEFEGRAIDGGVYTRWLQHLDDHGLSDVWQRLVTGYAEATPGGGMHIFLRTEGPALRNLKLARRAATEEELLVKPEEKVKVLIETRGEGGFVVTAPSHGSVHPDGRSWRLINGGWDSIATISVDEREALYAIARLLDELPEPEYEGSEPPSKTQISALTEAMRPGDDFNERGTWDFLTDYGWTKVHPLGNGHAWRRPGKNVGISATTDTREHPGMFVFSTSTELPDNVRLSRFTVYARLVTGGDHKAAAASLRREGYGTPTNHDAGAFVGLDPDPLHTRVPLGGQAQPQIAPVIPLREEDRPIEIEEEHTSWWPRKIGPHLDGSYIAEPATHLARRDGHRLFYGGKINGLIGESESGKSWVALLAAKQAVDVGETVLYLDFEDSVGGVVGRMRLLDAPITEENFLYVDPSEGFGDLQRADIDAVLKKFTPSLVIVDGVNAAMTRMGLDLMSNRDATAFTMLLLNPLAHSGACVVYVDHVPKAVEGRGKGGIGAQAKRAMTTGCALLVEVEQTFGRGKKGRLKLSIDKDRPGGVSEHCSATRKAGRVHINSDPETYHVAMEIEAPNLISDDAEKAPFRPTNLMVRVSNYLAVIGGKGASKNQVRANVDGKNDYIDQALERLVAEGFVEQAPGPRGALLHIHRHAYVGVDEGGDVFAEGGSEGGSDE